MKKIISFIMSIIMAIISFFTPIKVNLNVNWTGEETDREKISKIEEAYDSAVKYTPTIKYYPQYDYKVNDNITIQAITYDGLTMNGKKTLVFAYIGIPKKATFEEKVPGVVLVHGGGGHANYNWVKQWVAKGYAAISMDTTGYFPNKSGEWEHKLTEDFVSSDYTVSPDCDAVMLSHLKVDDQWIYHAVGQVISGYNVLKSFNCVDSIKIGLVGISWGAVLGTFALSYDSNFAFAVNFYGCGNLGSNLTKLNGFTLESTKKIWKVEDRYRNLKMPIMWVCGNTDQNFSVNVNSLCYIETRKYNSKTMLNIVNNYKHSGPTAMAYSWQYDFADSVINGGEKLTYFKTFPTARSAECTFEKSKKATSVTAKLYYITEHLSYTGRDIDQTWKAVSCKVEGNKVSAVIPSDAKEYYIELCNVINGNNHYVTSQIVVL